MQNDDHGDGEHDSPARPASLPSEVFGLLPEDEPLVRELAGAVRLLLVRQHMTPHMLRVVAGVLLALERMPLATSGVEAEIGLSRRFGPGAELSYQSLYVSPTALRLDAGEGASDTVFEVEVGGLRDGDRRREVAEWLARFRARAADENSIVDLEWLGDDRVIPWEDDGPGREHWRALPAAA